MLTRIVAHASKHGKLPSDVYASFMARPRDFRLLWEYEDYLAAEEKRQIDEAKKGKG